MSKQTGHWSRRGFLASLAALGAAHLAAPARGLGFAPEKKIKLGFDNFSIRGFDWKAPQLIEYAASVNADVLLMSDLNVYESLDDAYLKQVHDQADEAGVQLQVGTGSICPTSILLLTIITNLPPLFHCFEHCLMAAHEEARIFLLLSRAHRQSWRGCGYA